MKLIGYYDAERVKTIFTLDPLKQELFHSTLYKTSINELIGYRINYNRQQAMRMAFADFRAGLTLDLVHCYPLD